MTSVAAAVTIATMSATIRPNTAWPMPSIAATSSGTATDRGAS